MNKEILFFNCIINILIKSYTLFMSSKKEAKEKGTRFIYRYSRPSIDPSGDGTDHYKEYYIAKCADDVYRHVFGFMYLDRVEKYFNKQSKKSDDRDSDDSSARDLTYKTHTYHSDYTIEQVK